MVRSDKRLFGPIKGTVVAIASNLHSLTTITNKDYTKLKAKREEDLSHLMENKTYYIEKHIS